MSALVGSQEVKDHQELRCGDGNPNTNKVEKGGPGIQGQPGLFVWASQHASQKEKKKALGVHPPVS